MSEHPAGPPLAVDHEEAWDLACMRQDKSNLARCYLDLRRAAQMVVDTGSQEAIRQLDLICKTNRDDYSKQEGAR